MNLKKSKKKSLINVKNDYKECFLSCHITHLNPLKRHPERITQRDRPMVDSPDYGGSKFPVFKKTATRLKSRIASALMYLIMKMV